MRPSKADYAAIFKALGDETRLSIVAMLCGGELSALHLLKNLTVSQPTLSYHMKFLIDNRLVKARKDGSWVKYSLNAACLGSIHRYLSKLYGAATESMPQSQLAQHRAELEAGQPAEATALPRSLPTPAQMQAVLEGAPLPAGEDTGPAGEEAPPAAKPAAKKRAAAPKKPAAKKTTAPKTTAKKTAAAKKAPPQ